MTTLILIIVGLALSLAAIVAVRIRNGVSRRRRTRQRKAHMKRESSSVARLQQERKEARDEAVRKRKQLDSLSDSELLDEMNDLFP